MQHDAAPCNTMQPAPCSTHHTMQNHATPFNPLHLAGEFDDGSLGRDAMYTAYESFLQSFLQVRTRTRVGDFAGVETLLKRC
jgi:hypothetical protein